MTELHATWDRPAVLPAERRPYHGLRPLSLPPEAPANESLPAAGAANMTDVEPRVAVPKVSAPAPDVTSVVAAKAIPAESEEALYAEVVSSCLDTVAMLARHRVERAVKELADNEEQLLTQTDAIAIAGRDCIDLVVSFWREEEDDVWRAWAAMFTLASLEGQDTLDRVEDEIATLPAEAIELGERIAEALLVAPHPGVLASARNLMRSGNPIARALAIDVLAGRSQLSDDEVRGFLSSGIVPILRAAVRASRRLPAAQGSALLLPLLDHPKREVAWPVARQLARWHRPEPYMRVRDGLPLARVLGIDALELLIQSGDATDLDRFDEILTRTPVSEAHVSAVARFGHPTTWAFLVHYLSMPDFAEIAARGLVTLFGARVPSRDLLDARAWQAAIAEARLDPALRYRRGEPWRPGVVVQECFDGHGSRHELEVRLDELGARTGLAGDVDTWAWSPDLHPALRPVLHAFQRGDATWRPGSWRASTR